MKGFLDFTNKMKENLKQAMNSKEIHNYIKTFSENMKNNIINNNEEISEKYKNVYKNNDDNKNNRNILFMALISFHQKQGSVVECTYPPKEELLKDNDLINLLLPNSIEGLFSQLNNYGLIDGIHLINEDTNCFILYDYKKPIYCLYHYIQIKTSEKNEIIDDFQENVRECIQKSLCILSLNPWFINISLYKEIYINLKSEMTTFMNQKNLNDKSVLSNLHEKLISMQNQEQESNNLFPLFNIKKLYLLLREDLIIIIKLILLQKNILIYSKIPSNVSLLILCLLNYLPGEFCDYFNKFKYYEQNGMPLNILNENYLIYPLFTLFDLDKLLKEINESKINYLLGTTNLLLPRTSKLNYDAYINVDEIKISYTESLEDNLKSINSDEQKLIKTINDYLNKNNKNIGVKKIINTENWIINLNDDNKDCIEEECKFIKKEFEKYLMQFFIDTSFIQNEIENLNEKEKVNELLSHCQFINKKTNEYYDVDEDNMSKSINDKSSETEGNKENISINNNINNIQSLEEIITDPYINKLNNLLKIISNPLITNYNQDHTNIINNNKAEESILTKVNNIYFVTQWLKTKNFKLWTNNYKKEIKYLSKLDYIKLHKEKNITLIDQDYNEYCGQMGNGKKNGKGKIKYNENNYIYFGDFENDKRNGKGNLSSKDNKYIYEGSWKNDLFDGEGHLISDKLGKYSGEFKEGLFNGKGSLIDNNLNMYNGNFIKGEKSGKGELILHENGHKYIGEFQHNVKQGKGKFLDEKGNVVLEGNFKQDVFINELEKNEIKQ